MKKILVALAIAAFASTTFAGVAGSSHDMRAYATGATKGACQYCHAPHLWVDSGLTVAPLWNRTVLAAASITNRAGDSVSEITRACISCHDGTSDVTAALNNGEALSVKVVNGVVGTVLTNDHPVGVALVAAGEYQQPGAAFVFEAGNVVGCATCHDVHNQGPAAADSFLVVDNTTVDVCAQCHIK